MRQPIGFRDCQHGDITPDSAQGRRKIEKCLRAGLMILSILCPSIAARPALAATDSDVTIAARTLGFMEKPLSGAVRVGVVYAPDDPLSSRDAGALRKSMTNGLTVGGISLNPVMIPVESVGGANVDLLFLAAGVGARASNVRDTGQAKHIPCITLDIDQVRNGNCAIGIKSQPRVEILVNRDVASRSGVSFAGAFKMLITEF